MAVTFSVLLILTHPLHDEHRHCSLGYSIRDIHEIQLFSEGFESLAWERLGESVGNHFSRRYPLNLNFLSLNFLPKPMVMYVDVSEFRCKLGRFRGEQAKSLLVVTINGHAVSWIKVDGLKQPLVAQ